MTDPAARGVPSIAECRGAYPPGGVDSVLVYGVGGRRGVLTRPVLGE